MSESDRPVELPAAIAEFFDATNAGDSAAFVAAFSADAYLNDWGREFHGHDGVASWDRTDNIGKQTRFTVHGIRSGAGPREHVVSVTVAGNGYNGPGDFTFRLDGDGRIASFVIA